MISSWHVTSVGIGECLPRLLYPLRKAFTKGNGHVGLEGIQVGGLYAVERAWGSVRLHTEESDFRKALTEISLGNREHENALDSQLDGCCFVRRIMRKPLAARRSQRGFGATGWQRPTVRP